MLRRIWAITLKELISTTRDRATLIIVLSMPLMQILLFAYAIHMDIKQIPMVVADQSMDSASRAYLDALVHSDYFAIVKNVSGQAQAVQAIDDGTAKIGVVIPPEFATHVSQREAKVLIIVDGSDPFTTQSAYNTANAVAQQYAINLEMDNLNKSGQANAMMQLINPLTAHLRILYNPDLKDLWFLVPGMIAMLLQTQTLVLTAVAVVREREVGTIEQILVTPIRPVELMLGKTLPYLLIAVFNMLTIIVIGTVGFGVPFQGNLALFFVLSVIYAVSGLGLGLLISSVSQNQRQAQQLATMIAFVGQFLTGFIFPRYTMPFILSVLGLSMPLTYFIPVARGIFTKGIGIEYLWGPVAALIVFIVVIIFFAARLFKQRLD